MGNLKDLQKHRKDILRAEVAAWLHDMGKCADAFLQPGGMGFNAHVCQNNPRVNPHKAVYSPQELQNLPYWSSLSPQRGQCSRLEEAKHPTALWRTLQTISFTSQKLDILINLGSIGQIRLRELILWGRPLVADRYHAFRQVLSIKTHLAAILGQSHNRAHMEKEDEADGGQSQELEMPFGYYRASLDDLNTKLKRVLDVITDSQIPRGIKLYILKKQFASAPGDTRRPINEVTLWDWSSIVAALYKAEIARCVLASPRPPQDVAWRLLSLRTDGLAYMLSAPSIPDLLARKDLLTDAWNRVQKVLEEEYPLGLEVYRDENGPVFVVPDLHNLLGLENPDDNHKTLREYLLEAFRRGTVKGNPCLAIDGEIAPVFELDEKPWKGQPAPAELPPIGDHLKNIPPLQTDPVSIAQAWCHHIEEICSICGLRPQGPSSKAKRRKMCDICEERRADRATAWAEGTALSPKERFQKKKPDTIWLDEVADANGRLALLVGQFDLTHWLDGTLVRSLAVRTPNDQNGHTEDEVAKNPSFARLRRIWETTRRFWQDVVPTDAPPEELRNFCNSNGLDIETFWEGPLRLEESLVGKVVGKAGPRLLIHGALQPHRQGESPGPYHAYELRLGRVKSGVLWDPERRGFITLENLVYIARQLGHKPPKLESREDEQEVEEGASLHRWAAEIVRQEIQGQRLTLEEPTGYGGRNREWGTIDIQEVEPLPQPYVPVVPILAEPRTFMALVPADKALEVVRAIKTKYEREMGKVRNRLPLHLGIVFADAHQPLRTIMDAGRRMLSQKAVGNVGKWKVKEDAVKQTGSLPAEASDLSKGTQQFGEWYAVKLDNEDIRRTLTWYVPAVMGDGKTPDNWYPYVFWKKDKDNNTDPGSTTEPRTRYYQASNPFDPDEDGNPQLGRVVHVGELKEGDVIYFTPATVDFIFVDHGGRRFEIAYDQSGQRRGTLHRPYLLDEMKDLIACWNLLQKYLSINQIHQVRDLIENKRAEWFPEKGQPEDESGHKHKKDEGAQDKQSPENFRASINDATFKAYCQAVIHNAEWRHRKEVEPHLDRLTHWAVTGLLADAVELFYHIMKQRPVGEEET